MEVDSPAPSLLERLGDARRGGGNRTVGARRNAGAPYVGVYLFQFDTWRFNAQSTELLHSKKGVMPLALQMLTPTECGNTTDTRVASA